mmetsp:Transcript_62573/g.166251  ORF Transcript_62573/g.166251 Transcript_62573/m.166251 type:complete len:131 (-) Transcript_62573:707-1099(-)
MALALPSFTAGFVAPAAVPSLQQARSAVTMGVETELGATGPLGYWDPLGLATSKPEKFTRWRAVEIKHGRIAMMACTGEKSLPPAGARPCSRLARSAARPHSASGADLASQPRCWRPACSGAVAAPGPGR